MIGTPKTFNTKQDYINTVALVKEKGSGKESMIASLQSLLASRKVWFFQEEVDESYSPASDEKVMPQTDGEGEQEITTYHLFRLEDDPNCAFTRLGFTESEVNDLIAQLEE